jgi:hypothetical protein
MPARWASQTDIAPGMWLLKSRACGIADSDICHIAGRAAGQ